MGIMFGIEVQKKGSINRKKMVKGHYCLLDGVHANGITDKIPYLYRK
jgi:hypothetical protein